MRWVSCAPSATNSRHRVDQASLRVAVRRRRTVRQRPRRWAPPFVTDTDSKYHYGVPERTLTFDELTQLLERFSSERAGGKTIEEVTETQVRLLLARIGAFTDMLRGAKPDEAARLVSRMLLSDLAAVAAHFRGRANTMRVPLAKALADLHVVGHESADSERR